MKRLCLLLAVLAVGAALSAHAQDAATEERLNRLSGKIEDLIAAQEVLKRQIGDLAKELEGLREQSSRPSPNYARTEDFNSLARKIEEVDRKRLEDAETVRTELLRLRKVLEQPLASTTRGPGVRSPKDTGSASGRATPERGYEYVIQSGDTLDAIAQAYRERDIKVTVAQILKANPGLVPERMRVGQKIFIPAP